MPPAEAAVAVGVLRAAVLEGAAAPPELTGAYARIGSAAVNESGEVAFVAGLTGGRDRSEPSGTVPSAVLLAGAGETRVLARAGDPAPGGGRYVSFVEVDVGDAGYALVHARLAGCDAPAGLFLHTPDGVEPVARGDWFGQPTLTSFTLPSGPYFRLAYVSGAPGGRTSLVVWPSYTAPREILSAGMTLAGGEVSGFEISRLGLALCCVARIRRGRAERRTALLVSEDQVIGGERLREGGRFPDGARISRLADGSGSYVHTGFVALELRDGTMALASRPAGADPVVFARTGHPAPGLPGESIVRFGPPLANSGTPDGGTCGIASAVQLSGGGTALWFGAFVDQVTMAGAAIMPLVAKDRTDDGPSVVVDEVTPVKLTNGGILLLRTASGLFTLDGLFDWCGDPPSRA